MLDRTISLCVCATCLGYGFAGEACTPAPKLNQQELAQLVQQIRKFDPKLSEVQAQAEARRISQEIMQPITVAPDGEWGLEWKDAVGGEAAVSTEPGKSGITTFSRTSHPPPANGDSGFRLISTEGGMSTTDGTPQTSVFEDPRGRIEITIRDRKTRLRMTDAAGKQVYDGPIDTPAQKAALPAAVKDFLGPDFDVDPHVSPAGEAAVASLMYDDGRCTATGVERADGIRELTVIETKSGKVLHRGAIPTAAEALARLPESVRAVLATTPKRTPIDVQTTRITTGDLTGNRPQ